MVARDILNDDVNKKRSKSMDIRYYWLRDRIRQKQFYVHWKRGSENVADYVIKHHPTRHHVSVRRYYVSNSVARVEFS